MSYGSQNSEIDGELTNTNFATLLCDVYYKKATGCLSIHSDIELEIYFFQGFVEYVHSNDPKFFLGNLLVKNNYISEEEQQDVLDFSKENDLKLGQALIQMGKLTSHELKHILDLQLQLKLLSGFRIREGHYKFHYTDSIDVDALFHLNPVQIIYDAIDSHIFLGDIDLDTNELTSTIYPTLNFDELDKIIFSTSKEYKLVDMMRGPVELKEVMKNSPVGSQKTLNFLKFLKIAQFVRLQTKQ